MSDNEPKMDLNTGSGSLEATPRNTHLYLHLGELALYDHVFIETGRTDDNRLRGNYIFDTSDTFGQMREFMTRNGYPMHVNLREVAEHDRNAYDQMIRQQVQDLDQIPQDWTL